ncbi:hypothetical protein IG631_15134 [Alternaria alternata]|nr:hypothetical protein IG631_15134 [Alternaria alternata]
MAGLSPAYCDGCRCKVGRIGVEGFPRWQLRRLSSACFTPCALPSNMPPQCRHRVYIRSLASPVRGPVHRLCD